MNTKYKFLIIGIFVLLGMGGILLMGDYVASKITVYKNVEINISKVKNKILTLRQHEKDFLSTKNLKHNAEFGRDIKELIINIDNLEGSVEECGLENKNLGPLRKNLLEYGEIFKDLVDVQVALGLGPKLGLYGDLRRAVHNFESELKKTKNSKIKVDMLMLRRNEKDFMLRLNLKYLEKFRKNITISQTRLKNENVSKKYQKYLNEYQKYFEIFVAKQEELGLNNDSGLLGDLKNRINKSEFFLKKVSKNLEVVTRQEIGNIDDLNNQKNIVGFFIITLIIGVSSFLIYRILKKIDIISKTIAKAENENNLLIRIDSSGKDEFDATGLAFNKMLDKFHDIIKGIQKSTVTLNSSSDELAGYAKGLQSELENTSEKSEELSLSTEQISQNINSIASATEEMNVSVATVSSAAEQVSVNMNSVASAVEEMSATVQGISKSSQEASAIADKGSSMSLAATKKMNLLDEASQDIGKVTEVIKRIAEQTNLLALNATIEAASAGEAGKGFAVVAGEIKELANQSAHAAEDIAQKIGGVQENTKEAVTVIQEVTEIIESMNQSVTMTTSVVAEQEEATNEISRNVAESNEGVRNIARSIAEIEIKTNELSKNSTEVAQGTKNVTMNVKEVNESSRNSLGKVEEVTESSTQLAQFSERLHDMTGKFKV